MANQIHIARNVEAPFWNEGVAPYAVDLVGEGKHLRYGLRSTLKEAWALASWMRRAHANPRVRGHLHPRWWTNGQEEILT